MRRRSWHWLALPVLLLGLGLGCGFAARAGMIELNDARATFTLPGQPAPPGAAARAQEVRLPYHWDRHHPGQQGAAVFELSFELPGDPPQPWGLYLPRLGNAYEVWLNGTLLQRNGDLTRYNGDDYAQLPRYIDITQGLLAKTNHLRVHIRADVGRRGGLSQVLLGPQDEVRAAYLHNYRWRSTGSVVVVAFSFVVGLLALALWATQTDPTRPGRPHREPLYLFAGLAELLWTVRVGDALIETPPLPWPWWGVLPVVALGAWGSCMALFCVEVAGWRDHRAASWLRRWLGGLVLAGAGVAVWALRYGHPLALTVWYGALGLTFLAFGAVFLAKAWRGAPRVHRIVAVAILLNVLVGLRDLYVFRINPTYADNSLMRYSSVLFGFTLGYIVITRFRSASAQVRELMSTLSLRVAMREQELAQSYQQLELLARDQERTSERARILRDMHDGVGSHISAAIRQLQSGKASSEAVLQTLRESMDQLKLSIDAMSLPPGDITALLANLRYRLEPRFAASDIELQWAVELLEPLERLDAGAMRQLQFMVYGALSNVLQHAHATVLRIEAAQTPAGTRLRIVDNGRGFDTTAPLRNGLASLHERARTIGATVAMRSAPGETVIEFLIP